MSRRTSREPLPRMVRPFFRYALRSWARTGRKSERLFVAIEKWGARGGPYTEGAPAQRLRTPYVTYRT